MKHTITLSIFLTICLSAEEVSKPIEPPPLDPAFKELLESTEMEYTFTGNTPYFKLPQEDGKVEYVYVLPSTDEFGNYTIRRIVGYVYQEEKEKPSPEIMENALLFSKELRTSRFQLVGSDDSSWSLCVIGLFPNSGDNPTFKQMVEGIGYTTWHFKKNYMQVGANPKKDDPKESKTKNLTAHDAANEPLEEKDFKKSLALDVSIAEYFTKKAGFIMGPKEEAKIFEEEYGKGVIAFVTKNGDALILYSPTMTRFRKITVKCLFPLDKAEFIDLNEFKPISRNTWLGKFEKRSEEGFKPMMEYQVLVDVLETPEYNFDRLVSVREAIQIINEARVMVVDKDGDFEKLYEKVKKGLEEEAAKNRTSE